MAEEKRIRGLKKIGNSIAYGAFKIGKGRAFDQLEKLENEELKMAGTMSLEVADDVVRILTDDDPANRVQLDNYLHEPENRQKVLDMALAGLKGVAIEKLEGGKLDTVLELIGLLAVDLSEEEVEIGATSVTFESIANGQGIRD